MAGSANRLRLLLHWTGIGEEGTLTWWYTCAATHSQADLASALAAVVTGWTSDETPSGKTNILKRLSNSQACDYAALYQYPTSAQAAGQLATQVLSGWTGTATAARFPLQASQVVSLHTGTPGRSFRGRQYYPIQGLVLDGNCRFQNADCDGLLTLASVLGAGAGAHLGNSFTDNTVAWSVYSRKLDELTAVQTISVDNVPDTQRRRAFSQAPTYNPSQDVTG